ncbi:tetratricopeptide repeat protein [Azospirillum griseum]|uniref:protein O-GlcNAc transferase n=1 Tax=Azospirillum griseum TaxID=2496639 RepID=A0A431VC16_9PROT|nr:tetratricopeptide repeat protein [Azospirillum griseum]RTR15931.1 tetratricopeptide repeat protein [Azospirillum griseum]
MATILEALSIAFDHHRAGRLVEAETLYGRILDVDPTNATALQLLGALLADRGEDARAADLLARSLEQAEGNADVHLNRALVVARLGQLDEAEAHYRRALTLAPTHPSARNNLGLLLRDSGRREEAVAMLRQAVADHPTFAQAWFNLAATLDGAVAVEEVADTLDRAIGHCPDFAPLRTARARLQPSLDQRQAERTLAQAQSLHAQGRLDDALVLCRNAMAAADAPHTLGNLLEDLGRSDAAVEWQRRAVALQPDDARAFYALGTLHARAHRYGAARAACARAQTLVPHVPKVHMAMGGICFEQGDLPAAITALRRALALDPDLWQARSGLLFALGFDEEADPDDVYQEHRAFDRQHIAPLGLAPAPHTNSRDPERRLRVGYVSPNFYGHPCGNFVLPLVENADRAGFSVTCYATSPVRDALTDAFERAADRFVLCHDLDDEALAARIRADGIDLLVDCSGHLTGHRLFTFARKPAPIQISYPLYPDTTGLSAMDYRIMDRWFAPPGSDVWHSEALIRLPDIYVVFKPRPSDAAPDPVPPAMTRGFVTFGSFNNLSKLGDRTVAAWAAILRGAPTAKLLLKWRSLNDPDFAAATRARFTALGVEGERIELMGWTGDPHEAYRRVDIALDPLIANGGTTSCEALWMGVPVLTCAGRRMFSCVGECYLENIGMTELITRSVDAFVALGVELAGDPARIARLRQGLRERVASSPLMDAPRYVRHLERAYRLVWRRWCAGLPPAPIGPEAFS